MKIFKTVERRAAAFLLAVAFTVSLLINIGLYFIINDHLIAGILCMASSVFILIMAVWEVNDIKSWLYE